MCFSQERQSGKTHKATRRAIIALGHGDIRDAVVLFLHLKCVGEHRDAF